MCLYGISTTTNTSEVCFPCQLVETKLAPAAIVLLIMFYVFVFTQFA